MVKEHISRRSAHRQLNQRLTEHRIRTTCRELIAGRGGRVSGRALRRELRVRFGAVGQTARVFQIWREETGAEPPGQAVDVSKDVGEMQKQLLAVQAAARENQARAERAEYREQAHQEHWAQEVDRLRQELLAQPRYASEIRALQERVLQLSVELQAARKQLSQRE